MTKKRIENVVIISLITGFGLYMYFGNKISKEYLYNKEQSYGIAEIILFKRGAKVAPWFVYEFELDGVKYEGDYDMTGDTLRGYSNEFLRQYIGRKYLVRYSVEKPKYSELYIDKPIPDSLLDCTDCRWDKPPF